MLLITGKPHSVAQINKDTIAITYSYMEIIKIFNIENETVTKVIKVHNYCFGLSFSNESLAVGLNSNEIRIIDLEGKRIKSIQVQNESYLKFLVYSDNRIIYSDRGGYAVNCIDGSGKQIWHYKQDLSEPYGLSADTFGNIIVADCDSKTIIAISKDGNASILEWTVVGKVTEYGQNVTLFCNVPHCCPEDSGWDRWTPVQQTLFIDVKTGRSNKKYDGKVLKDGYTLVIQNLTKNDLNVSYSCLYGVTLGERKFLLEEDVFNPISPNVPNGQLSPSEISALIIGVIVLVLGSVTISIYFWRRRIDRSRSEETEDGSDQKDKLLEKVTEEI
ncbi:Hypothetical predicted protein, partial [Mytilus galloprovincialis]